MPTLSPSVAAWLRLTMFAASGLVLASVVTGVCVRALRPAPPPEPPAGEFLRLDERSYRQAVDVDRLYEGIEMPGSRPAEKAP
jgi:hypothetical protein